MAACTYKTWALPDSNAREVHVSHAHGKASGYFVFSSRWKDYVHYSDSIETDVYDAAIETFSRYHIHRFAYLQSLEVEAEYRREGIGSLLLKKFISVARQHNVQVVTLFANADRRRNYPRLERFYLRHGFENLIGCRAEFELWLVPKLAMKPTYDMTLNQVYMEARRRRHAETP